MKYNPYEFIFVRKTIMNKFTPTPFRKIITHYLRNNEFDHNNIYYKHILVRTYTSEVHERLNELFSRVKVKDFSTNNRIYTTVRIYHSKKPNHFIDLSYVHYHSIGIDPLYTFEMNINDRLIRHELYMDKLMQ